MDAPAMGTPGWGYAAVREVTVPGRLTVLGDLHGKPRVLEAILAERGVEDGLASGEHVLVSVGDLVDRGPVRVVGGRPVHVGVEALLDRIVDLAARHPRYFHVIAGNHEVAHLADVRSRRLGPGDVSRWGRQGVLTLTRERISFLETLPVAIVLTVGPARAVVVHGGPPARAISLRQMAPAAGLLEVHDRHAVVEMVWGNPAWSAKAQDSTFVYSRRNIVEFLEANEAAVLVRGHRNEPELRDLGCGRTFICVHSAQGDPRADDPAEGYLFLAWDPPGPPRLAGRGPAARPFRA